MGKNQFFALALSLPRQCDGIAWTALVQLRTLRVRLLDRSLVRAIPACFFRTPALFIFLFLLLFSREIFIGDDILFHSKFHFASYRIASFSRLRTNQL